MKKRKRRMKFPQGLCTGCSHPETLPGACFRLLLSLWPSQLILSGFAPSAYCHPFPIPRPPEVLFPGTETSRKLAGV